jgi:DNA-directed RNA polymerase subunit M/transcription elongation factor TFIIS
MSNPEFETELASHNDSLSKSNIDSIYLIYAKLNKEPSIMNKKLVKKAYSKFEKLFDKKTEEINFKKIRSTAKNNILNNINTLALFDDYNEKEKGVIAKLLEWAIYNSIKTRYPHLFENSTPFINAYYCLIMHMLNNFESSQLDNPEFRNNFLDIVQKSINDQPTLKKNLLEFVNKPIYMQNLRANDEFLHKQSESIEIEQKGINQLYKSKTGFKCRRCKSIDTYVREIQKRSADEPANIYVNCSNCYLSVRIA